MLACIPDTVGFVPCYVNSRLTAQGIPVSCEVDIYGTLSEFIGQVVSDDIVTLLDINNSVPKVCTKNLSKENSTIHFRIPLWDFIVETQHPASCPSVR